MSNNPFFNTVDSGYNSGGGMSQRPFAGPVNGAGVPMATSLNINLPQYPQNLGQLGGDVQGGPSSWYTRSRAIERHARNTSLRPFRFLQKVGSEAIAKALTNFIRYAALIGMALFLGTFIWFWIVVGYRDQEPMVVTLMLLPGLVSHFAAALNYISIQQNRKSLYYVWSAVGLFGDAATMAFIFYYFIEIDYLVNVCANPDPTTVQPLFCTSNIIKGTTILSLLMQIFGFGVTGLAGLATMGNMAILTFYSHRGVIVYKKEIALEEAMKIDEEAAINASIDGVF